MRGWGDVASVLHSTRRLDSPLLLAFVFTNWPTLWVDFGTMRYCTDGGAGSLADDPGTFQFHSRPTTPDDDPYPWASWRPLEPFLWDLARMGLGESRARWMRPDDHYSLASWPNLTELTHDGDDIQVIAAISASPLDIADIALVTGAPRGNVQRLINSLTLVGAAHAVEGSVTPPPLVQELRKTGGESEETRASRRSASLFGRLRRRLAGGR